MPSIKCSWSSFSAVSLVLLSHLLAHKVLAEVQAPLKVLPPNRDYHQPVEASLDARGVLNLFERQSGCYSPNLYCPLYNKCCSSTELGCCPSGCTSEIPNECCLSNDGYCTTGFECCDEGCMPAGSECCKSGGHCPSPFHCVLYDGVAGCCTDLTCSVYLSSGVPVTVAPTAAPTVATTVQYTEYYYTYTTWIYWYYWYYYYTIYYSPSTYITREITTVTQTTTVTFSATDTYQASILYSSLSAELPTPTNAEITIPATPTVGALIIGSCSSTTTSTITASDGSTFLTTVSVCDTSTADGRTTSPSSRTSTSRAAATTTPSGGSGGSSGAQSGATRERVTWLLCALIHALIGGAMIAL